MPIRPRLTKPDGDEYKEFTRFMKEGPRPKPPRKPSKAERQPFIDALMQVPLYKKYKRRAFNRLVIDKYITRTFNVYGKTLYIYPRYHSVDDECVRCTGALVGTVETDRHGRKISFFPDGDPRTWYAQVLNYLDEKFYGG
jgi:hypothetical protein